jgi:hypothetical protein
MASRTTLPALSRDTLDLFKWVALFSASTCSALKSPYAALPFTAKAEHKGISNPNEHEEAFQRMLSCASEKRHGFPHSGTDEDKEKFSQATLMDIQMAFYDELLNNVASEIQDAIMTQVPGKYEHLAGTKAWIVAVTLCTVENEQTKARALATAVQSTLAIRSDPASAPDVLSKLISSANKIGKIDMTISRLLTVLFSVSLATAPGVTRSAQGVADKLVEDESLELNDAQRLLAQSINSCNPVCLPGSHGGGSYAAAAALAPRAGTQLNNKGHIVCSNCGRHAGREHSSSNCTIDAKDRGFKFGVRSTFIQKGASRDCQSSSSKERGAHSSRESSSKRNSNSGDLRNSLGSRQPHGFHAKARACVAKGEGGFTWEGSERWVDVEEDSGDIFVSMKLKQYVFASAPSAPTRSLSVPQKHTHNRPNAPCSKQAHASHLAIHPSAP